MASLPLPLGHAHASRSENEVTHIFFRVECLHAKTCKHIYTNKYLTEI